MNKTRSLDELLRCHDLTADQFFQHPAVAQQIRSKLNRFVKYVKSHGDFARRMLYLALNVPLNDLQDLALKTAAHAVTEVLSNEEPEIAELFFEAEARPAPEGSDIPEELEGGIQSEAQRLLGFDDDQQGQAQQQRPVEIQKLELATLSLQILRDPERNNTCLGHLHKIYSFLIRHNPLPVLQYFQDRPDALQLLLSNLRYSSVSSTVAQLLTSEDKSRTYAFEGLKRSIISFVIGEIFVRMEDEDFFEGVMILVQEILNTTKQSYYEYFQDFKRVSNLLVCSDVMDRFLKTILALNEKSFKSASRFLEFLFSRINSQREDNSYYHRGEETDPSMNFQVDLFFQNITTLLELVPRIHSFTSLTKISYISFLEALLVTAKTNGKNFAVTEPAFLSLLACLNKQEKGGIFKNKLYNLISAIISRATAGETAQFLEAHGGVWEEYFSVLKAANYSNTKVYNKNESSAFELSLISQLGKKNEAVIASASKAIGKDLKRMCKKYETKIASFQSSSSFLLEDLPNFEQFSFDSSNRNDSNSSSNSSSTPSFNSSSTPSFSLNFVGKNCISIPVLQLPDRYHSSHEEETKERSQREEDTKERSQREEDTKERSQREEDTKERSQREEETKERSQREEETKERSQREVPPISAIKEIIEVEEVVVLTDTIQTLTLQDREDCYIQRPPELSRNDQYLDSPQKPPQHNQSTSEKEAVDAQDKRQAREKQLALSKLKQKNDVLIEQARFFAKYLPIFA